jgi:hypothetical protein
MSNSIVLLILVTLLLIGIIYISNFFSIESVAIIIAVFGLFLIFFDDDKEFVGGGSELIHSHDTTLIGGKEMPYTKMNLMDPKHNIREIAKQLILLEDHMAHKPKRCIDCITKHYLMVEGLLEEAITLDNSGEHIEEVRELTEQLKPAIMRIIDLIKNGKINDGEYHSACQVLRAVRKKIALKYVLNN